MMKDLKISKELLREVLELNRIDEIYIEDNILYFCELNEGINIYEFAFNCKEWIVTQGYGIKTETYDYMEDDSFSGTYWYIIRLRAKNWKDAGYPNCGANATEIEAIIKACEWILENEIEDENKLQLQEDLTEYSKLIKEGL